MQVWASDHMYSIWAGDGAAAKGHPWVDARRSTNFAPTCVLFSPRHGRYLDATGRFTSGLPLLNIWNSDAAAARQCMYHPCISK